MIILRILQQFILTTIFAVFASQSSAMFIQADTLDPTVPGVGTNRYAYSGNDPVNQRDPNGNWYEGHYGVYPTVPYNTNPNANPLARALDNTGRYILNTPTSMLNLFADGLYGTGEAFAPHAGTIENLAMTTPTAADDLAAAAIHSYTRLSTAVAQQAARASAFSQTEPGIIGEARVIMSSSGMQTIQDAHIAGRGVTVEVSGRVIQYEPNLPASGMTMFGNNGFLIGPEAFATNSELGKTVLHELYRLGTSRSAGGVSAELVTQETRATAQFVERAFEELY